jgi:hypothetical protein
MSKKYILPTSLKYPFEQSEFPGDLNLREIREHGEKNKLPEVSFYQAIVIALLEQRNYFVVEAIRYAKEYGQLPQVEEQDAEAEEKTEFPELKVITSDEPIVERFRKSYE